MPSSEIARLYGISTFSFLRNLHTVAHSGYINFIPTNIIRRFSFSILQFKKKEEEKRITFPKGVGKCLLLFSLSYEKSTTCGSEVKLSPELSHPLLRRCDIQVNSRPKDEDEIRQVQLWKGRPCLLLPGNGNPLQYSCLENPMDRGAW